MTPWQAIGKVPGLLFSGRVSYDFDGIPITTGYMSWRKRINLLKTGWGALVKSDRAYGLPPIIQVEPANVCNLRCPLCPTGSGTLERPQGIMELETFRRIIDETGETLIAVHLFCFGEPFLNRRLPEMVKLCSSREIHTLTSTNGHFLQTPEEAEATVDSGLGTLIIAVDGSTQEIYQSYRKQGDLDKVKRCIEMVEKAKTRLGSSSPYTVLRAVVTADNANDIPNLERLARDLNVNMFSTKTVGCMTHEDGFREFEPHEQEFRRFEYSGASRVGGEQIRCIFPFRQPIIFWDGTVVGCEYDDAMEMAFGRVGREDFHTIWNSMAAQNLRRSILSGSNKPGFCRKCPYQDRVIEGCGLWCKELRPAAQSGRR